MRTRKSPVLPVIYADIALNEIGAIATWNEATYGRDHAKRYITFLEQRIDALGSHYAKGKALTARPDIRYSYLQRRSKGHGHVAVYRFDNQAVYVLHVFHTAQNWQSQIEDAG